MRSPRNLGTVKVRTSMTSFKKPKTPNLSGNLLTRLQTHRSIRPRRQLEETMHGTLATSDKEKGRITDMYFASIGESQAKNLPRPFAPIQTLYTKVTPTIDTIDITQEKVQKYIEILSPQKATGPDGVSPWLLKLTGQSVTARSTVIFNRSVGEISVPSTWMVLASKQFIRKEILPRGKIIGPCLYSASRAR